MKLGLFGINNGIFAEPGLCRRVAAAADAAGLDSLWTGEHVVLPDPQVAPSPAAPDFPMLHPPALLAFLAAVTERIGLGTGITLVAQRNPVVLAKEMATVDVLSRGRLILGVGAGYLEAEFRALGIPFHERGARTDGTSPRCARLWTSQKPAFGKTDSPLLGIDAGRGGRRVGRRRGGWCERRGDPPRVAIGQGWYGFAMDVATAQHCIERVRAECRRVNRTLPIEFSITPRGRLTAETIREFAGIGVDRLIPILPQSGERDALAFIDQLAAFG
jgi:alkanesulfonate monooxygenase SsuD/methylene tetrahydromethanopterin reductase-like flavin-dependent oxidoreductase (luciferase family)